MLSTYFPVILSKPAIIFTILLSLKDYEKQKKSGKDPVFDPVSLGINDEDFWETHQELQENIIWQ